MRHDDSHLPRHHPKEMVCNGAPELLGHLRLHLEGDRFACPMGDSCQPPKTAKHLTPTNANRKQNQPQHQPQRQPPARSTPPPHQRGPAASTVLSNPNFSLKLRVVLIKFTCLDACCSQCHTLQNPGGGAHISWTLGDLGGGGGRAQSLLCLSSWEGEREREWEHTGQCATIFQSCHTRAPKRISRLVFKSATRRGCSDLPRECDQLPCLGLRWPA